MTAEAFPLYWPDGWPREQDRERAKFKCTLGVARDNLLNEIHLMGGDYTVLSTNIPVRNDGLPYANQRNPEDPGVAVYFMLKGKQMVFASDRWDKVEHNIRAIEKTINAMRGIERWGASDMMVRAFSAFEALPAPGWQTVLGVSSTASKEEIEGAFREKAKKAHPDLRGTDQQMTELLAAKNEGLRQCTY